MIFTRFVWRERLRKVRLLTLSLLSLLLLGMTAVGAKTYLVIADRKSSDKSLPLFSSLAHTGEVFAEAGGCSSGDCISSDSTGTGCSPGCGCATGCDSGTAGGGGGTGEGPGGDPGCGACE